MTRPKSFLIWLGLLFGLILGLIWLFGTANRPQTASHLPQAAMPTVAVTTVSVSTPEPAEVRPTLVSPIVTPAPGPRSAGILFESTGELYWQPMDNQGQPLATAARVPIAFPEKSKVGKMFPALDGSRVVYELYAPTGACCDAYSTLYIFSPPNGQPRQIPAPPPIAKIFGWYPDNRHLIYGDGGIVGLFDVDTGERTVVSHPQQWADLPYDPQIDGAAFSPDGKRLAVSFSLSGQEWEMWTANVDDSDPKRLFKSAGGIFALAWSPDGNHLAFVGPPGLEIIDPDGQNRKTLSPNFVVGWGFEPRWSPDSRWIAFTAPFKIPPDFPVPFSPSDPTPDPQQTLFKYHKVHLVDVATGKERRLVPDDMGGEVEPAWLPDSQHVIVLSNRSGAAEVWVVSLDSTRLQQLTSDARPKRATPIWLPTLMR